MGVEVEEVDEWKWKWTLVLVRAIRHSLVASLESAASGAATLGPFVIYHLPTTLDCKWMPSRVQRVCLAADAGQQLHFRALGSCQRASRSPAPRSGNAAADKLTATWPNRLLVAGRPTDPRRRAPPASAAIIRSWPTSDKVTAN